MNTPHDPVFGFYASLPQQGPGSDADAEAALLPILDSLPPRPRVADLGCGTGRSTLYLARRLGTGVIAVDLDPTFCRSLATNAVACGLSAQVDVRQGDMSDPPVPALSLDLLWCEGAAYIIGFAKALERWRALIRPGGFCVVSECAWLSEDRPEPVARFFGDGYPEMTTLAGNVARAEAKGYSVLATHVVSAEGWERYYGPIRRALREGELERVDPTFADELREEIRIYDSSAGSFGYVFYVLKKGG